MLMYAVSLLGLLNTAAVPEAQAGLLLQSLICLAVLAAVFWAADMAAQRQCTAFAVHAKQNFRSCRPSLSCSLTAAVLTALLLYLPGVFLLAAPLPALLPALLLGLGFYTVSALKFRILKEPLVWSDLLLLKELMLCPRYYLGYVRPWVLAVGALLLCAFAGLELYLLAGAGKFIPLSGCAGAAVLFLVVVTASLKLAEKKALSLGEICCSDACLLGAQQGIALNFALGIAALRLKLNYPEALAQQQARLKALRAQGRGAEVLVLVQAESWIELSRLQSAAAPQSELKRSAEPAGSAAEQTLQGLFDIDYFGAYTMRSEFAVLTGIDPQKLGAFASDPYQLVHKLKSKAAALGSLAQLLKQQGWRTAALHLNSGRFFSRRQVLQALGFAELYFAEDLNTADKSDRSLGQAVVKLIQDAKAKGEKLLVFAISLSGHGPYAGRDFAAQSLSYAQKQQDLYHCLQQIKAVLGPQDRLLVYGDHLPPLTGIEQAAPVEALKPEVQGFNFKRAELKDAGLDGAEGGGLQLCSSMALNALMLRAGDLYA